MKNSCNYLVSNDLSSVGSVKYLKRNEKKLIVPHILNKLNTLKSLLRQQDSKCWEIGDLCVELMNEHQISVGQISKFTDYSKTRISHFHLTARFFPMNTRIGCNFQDCLTARQIYYRLPRLNMTPVEIRELIITMRNKTPYQVRSYFIKLLTEKEKNQHLANSAKTYIYKDRIINNCYNSDWRQVIPSIPNQSVQLFICDPPFAISPTGYISKKEDTNAMRTDCDNGYTEEQALEVTLPLFELCLPKLAPDGIMLLFQGGGKADRIEVLKKAQECGWDCLYGLIWNKGHLSMCNFQKPYLICTERILLFVRKGTKPTKYQDGLPHSDVLCFPTETQTITKKMHVGKVQYGDYHMFQKPPELLEFLVQHHSFPGDLVVEPFGCSGSGVIAASKLNRQWVYVESNKENYSWGSQRVMKAISKMTLQAG